MEPTSNEFWDERATLKRHQAATASPEMDAPESARIRNGLCSRCQHPEEDLEECCEPECGIFKRPPVKAEPGPVTHFTTPPELGDGQHSDAWPAHPALFPGFDLAGAIEIWLTEHANPGDTVTITARGGEMSGED